MATNSSVLSREMGVEPAALASARAARVAAIACSG